MNPDRLAELEKRVTELERAQNVPAMESLMEYFIKNVTDVTDANVGTIISITIPDGGGTDTASVLDYPDKWLEFRYKGELYRIGAWLKRLDSSR
jgi:predicted metal-dependent peptidase